MSPRLLNDNNYLQYTGEAVSINLTRKTNVKYAREAVCEPIEL